MTDEQIKVLEELRDDGVLAGCIDVEEQKALTAVLEYVRDMREIEAEIDWIQLKDGRSIEQPCDQVPGEQCWHVEDNNGIHLFNSLREAWADAWAARKSAAKKQRQRFTRMVNKAFKEESK